MTAGSWGVGWQEEEAREEVLGGPNTKCDITKYHHIVFSLYLLLLPILVKNSYYHTPRFTANGMHKDGRTEGILTRKYSTFVNKRECW